MECLLNGEAGRLQKKEKKESSLSLNCDPAAACKK